MSEENLFLCACHETQTYEWKPMGGPSDSDVLRKSARIVENLPLENSLAIASWLKQAAEFSENLG